MRKEVIKLGMCVIATGTLVNSDGYAQNVGINTTGASPNSSAALDIDFPDKGLLIPRVALTSPNDATTIPQPATSLLVYNTGTGGLTPAGYYYNAGTPNSPNWVKFLNTGTPSDAWLTSGNAGTTPGTHFIGTKDPKHLVFKTNNTEVMRILDNGYVGIGTSAPNERLTVNGFIMINTGQPDGGRLIWRGGTGGTQEYRARVATDGHLGFFPVEVGNQGHIGEVLWLYQTGEVRVGNTSFPTSGPRFEIANSVNTEFLRMTNGTTNPLRIFFGNNLSGVNYPLGVVYFDISGTETYVFGGHVEPDDHLTRDLGSNIHYWRNIYTGDIYLNSCGQWLSVLLSCPSDERYKKDIQPLGSSLNKIMQLKPVTYYWRKEEYPDLHFDDKKQVGLIAQEVEKIFPEIVNENDKGYKSINYGKLSPILISAIQEQQRIIDSLQQKIKIIEQQNQFLYSEIQKIKQQIVLEEAKNSK